MIFNNLITKIMGYFYFAAAFAVALISAALWMRKENNKLNVKAFRRGGLVSNYKTGNIGIVSHVDHHNKVLHTSIGGLHFSAAEPVEVGCFVDIKATKTYVEITGICKEIINTAEGDFHYSLVKR